MEDYASYTHADPSRVKRALHRRRFADALRLLDLGPDDTLLDLGCGDGFLLSLASGRLPAGHLAGYEPAREMAEQARARLAPLGVPVVGDLADLGDRRFTRLACLETLEHLPPAPLAALLAAAAARLAPGGFLLASVPVEIGPPSLAKNLFRLARAPRRPDLDGRRLLRALLGLPNEREAGQALSGLPYHFSHVGFDHRRLERRLAADFRILARRGSPCSRLGPAFNTTLYYRLAPRHA
ncbi:MAG: methyltransferase domain-containing protein [Candidatus Krumholzibacteriota bacterium]|nr:methyltransferase domain-containing protein [Candidatus Krumholzibacteriota bacterium]